jgi:nitrite reductase/ring-hydroxylating ferredoxin subunit
MAFQRAASLAEIPENAGIGVMVEGREIGLYRIREKLYAMEDVCPHAGSLLSGGAVEGTLVACPGHGWEFDLETGLAPGECEEEPLIRYPVRVEGDAVYVDLEAPIARGRPPGPAVGGTPG